MTAAELTDLKRTLRQLLPDEGPSAVIAALKKVLPENAAKFSALFQLETRLNMANRDKIRGVLSQEQLELAYNRIASDLMDLLDGLEEPDFSPAGAAAKTGSILYKIPHTMQVNQEKRCIVRLAFEEDAIIRNIELVDAVLQPIRVAEVMEVDLVDPNEEPAFSIRQINSAEQFIEKGDFTEWVFFVKPLRTGELPLALRVSVLEVVAGRDRKKEIVLEETIHVVAEPDNDGFEETTTFKNIGYSVSYSTGAETGAPPAAEPPAEGSNIRRLSVALLVFLLLGAGAWALGLLQETAWLWAKTEDTKNAYENYLKKYPNGRHRGQAEYHIDLLDWETAQLVGTLKAFQIYRHLHPDSHFAAAAQQQIDSLERGRLKPDSLPPAGDSLPPDSVRIDSGIPPAPPGIPKPAPKPEPKNSAANKQKKSQPLHPPKPAPVPTPPPATPQPKPDTAANRTGRRSGFEMVPVTGGAFTMGDAKGENDECPHVETVKSFKIGKYEITQADWKEIMGSNPSFFKGCDECPVENISWNDAQQFILKAGIIRGARYRLPTEAEWEYAARGGPKSEGQTYAAGNRAGPVAWNHGNAERPNRVGRKRANQLGIYDMCGNVWEWCSDLYQPYPNCKGKAGSDRVLRGGSWRNYDDACRVSNRNQEKPNKREYVNGLRLVQER